MSRLFCLVALPPAAATAFPARRTSAAHAGSTRYRAITLWACTATDDAHMQWLRRPLRASMQVNAAARGQVRAG